jgi:flagellar biosynthesis/type III secretory pathway protein FliH
MELHEAKKEGRDEGMQEGLEKGMEQGLAAGREAIALNLILQSPLDNAAIAAMCSLEIRSVVRLREQYRS